MGKKLQRSCVACRTRVNKFELLRLTKLVDGEQRIDIDFKRDGRGAYLCKSEACLNLAQKKRGLERALRCKVKPEIFEELRTMLKVE